MPMFTEGPHPAYPAAEPPEISLTPHPPWTWHHLALTHCAGFLGLDLCIYCTLSVCSEGASRVLNPIVNSLLMDGLHPSSVGLASTMAGSTSRSARCRSWVSFCFSTVVAWRLRVRVRGNILYILCWSPEHRMPVSHTCPSLMAWGQVCFKQ